MALDELRHDVEREALFFALLRERARPAPAPGIDIERRLHEADAAISEWLDEAEEEGACIIDRARSEAARLRAETAAAVASLHADVAALQDQLASLVDRAGALLPALEAATRLLGPAPVAAGPPAMIVVDNPVRPGRLARLLRRA